MPVEVFLSGVLSLKKNTLKFVFVCVHFRVELNKNQVLDQIDLNQELMNEALRRRKVALDQTVERIKTELLVCMLRFFIC